MGHYYTTTGEPAYFQPKKDGSGLRPTTVRDARELGLLPSVTEVLKILDKPALNEWRIRTAVHAVVTAPDVPGESLDDKLKRVLETESQQDEEAQRARDLGTDIHDAIEKVLSGQPMPKPELAPWVNPAIQHIRDRGATKLTCEQILVGDGYAGKTDLILQYTEHLFTPWAMLVDFKTTKTLPKKGSWSEHKMQLAAYAEAFRRLNPDMLVKTANMYISTTVEGSYIFCENGPWEKDFDCFHYALKTWQHLNNHKGY